MSAGSIPTGALREGLVHSTLPASAGCTSCVPLSAHAILLCVSVSKFLSSYKDTSHGIRAHPNPVWPHVTVITSGRPFQIRSLGIRMNISFRRTQFNPQHNAVGEREFSLGWSFRLWWGKREKTKDLFLGCHCFGPWEAQGAVFIHSYCYWPKICWVPAMYHIYTCITGGWGKCTGQYNLYFIYEHYFWLPPFSPPPTHPYVSVGVLTGNRCCA